MSGPSMRPSSDAYTQHPSLQHPPFEAKFDPENIREQDKDPGCVSYLVEAIFECRNHLS